MIFYDQLILTNDVVIANDKVRDANIFALFKISTSKKTSLIDCKFCK